MSRILIYGVGNPYRCDDRVGIEIAAQLKARISNQFITIKSGSIDGLAMLDEIIGYDKVIFVDSIKTKQGNPGDIYKIIIDPAEKNQAQSLSHGIDFLTAIRIGRQFSYELPKKITVFAVEIQDNESFKEQCTAKVKKSIPMVIEKVLEEINHKSVIQ